MTNGTTTHPGSTLPPPLRRPPTCAPTGTTSSCPSTRRPSASSPPTPPTARRPICPSPTSRPGPSHPKDGQLRAGPPGPPSRAASPAEQRLLELDDQARRSGGVHPRPAAGAAAARDLQLVARHLRRDRRPPPSACAGVRSPPWSPGGTRRSTPSELVDTLRTALTRHGLLERGARPRGSDRPRRQHAAHPAGRDAGAEEGRRLATSASTSARPASAGPPCTSRRSSGGWCARNGMRAMERGRRLLLPSRRRQRPARRPPWPRPSRRRWCTRAGVMTQWQRAVTFMVEDVAEADRGHARAHHPRAQGPRERAAQGDRNRRACRSTCRSTTW